MLNLRAANELAATSLIFDNAYSVYPESIKGLKVEGDYSSSPKIWEDKAGFAAKIDGFAKVVTEVSGKIKDLDSLKANVPAIGKECSACHETFRLKNS